MGKKTFTKQDIQAAVDQDTDESSPLTLEYVGQWLDEGKYQCQENILKEIATGDFYGYPLSKSGSHFTDYTYSWEWESDEIELTQVVKTTKVIEVWVDA